MLGGWDSPVCPPLPLRHPDPGMRPCSSQSCLRTLIRGRCGHVLLSTDLQDCDPPPLVAFGISSRQGSRTPCLLLRTRDQASSPLFLQLQEPSLQPPSFCGHTRVGASLFQNGRLQNRQESMTQPLTVPFGHIPLFSSHPGLIYHLPPWGPQASFTPLPGSLL